jgi:protein-tyrosine-phosphatase/predicted ATP-grasp superfamily ATP-dependent carboligase
MKPNAQSFCILVTDAHDRAGLGAVRSLGRAGYTVVAGFSQEMAQPPSVWSRYCADACVHPDPWRHQFEFRDWLCEQAKSGRYNAVLPISEASILGSKSVRFNLPRDFLTIMPSDAALEFALSKFLSTQLARSLGILCPPTIFVSNGTAIAECNKDLSGLRFPIIIKSDNCLTAEGVYVKGGNFVVRNTFEARRVISGLELVQTRIIAQEVIPGSGVGVFLLRHGGKVWLRFGHRRLHEVPYAGGPSSLRESCRDDELAKQAEAILDAIAFEGVAMVEFRRQASDGRPYFLEINGRLWGSLALALHAGIDFPTALIECCRYGATTVKAQNYRSGMKCRNIFPGEIHHLVSIVKANATEKTQPPPSKVRAILGFFALFLVPTIRHDYLWWSDPLPGLVQATRITGLYAKKLLSKTVHKLATKREDYALRRHYLRHRIQCAQARYFQQAINQVLFLCYGNLCRSPFAEHCWRRKISDLSLLGPRAASAGFHPKGGRRTPAWLAGLAAEYGVDLTSHRSRPLDRKDVELADAIFLMDRNNYQQLLSRFPEARNKTYFLGLFANDRSIEIEDPYEQNENIARLCLDRLSTALDGMLRHVLSSSPQSHGPDLRRIRI